MDQPPAHPARTPELDLDGARELLGALARVLAIAPLYPSGHARFVKVAEELRARLRDGCDGPTLLTIGVAADHLRVRSVPVVLESAEARRIHEILWPLGISRIEIESNATAEDIHLLTASLIRQSRQLGSANKFRQDFFREQPETVHVRYHEFGRRVGGSFALATSHDRIRSAMSKIETHLQDLPESPESIDRSCRVAQALLSRVAEKLETNPGSHAPQGGVSGRNLDEVLDLCASVISTAMEDLLHRDSTFEDLSSLFESAELALALSDDQDTANLMLDVLREARNETAAEDLEIDPEGKSQWDEETHELSFAALTRVLQGIADADTERFEPRDPGEQLSVFLQLLLDGPSPRCRRGIARRLECPRSPAPSSFEYRVLRGAVDTLLDRGDFALVDRTISFLASILRELDSTLIPALLLSACESSPSPETFAAAWPHLLNELIGGSIDDDIRLRGGLVEVFCAADPSVSERDVDRLARLLSLSSRPMSERAFEVATPYMLPILASLLESSDDRMLGDWVLRGVQAHCPPWAGAEILVRLHHLDSRARPLVTCMLREGLPRRPSPHLQDLAADLIIRTLEELPRTRRSESWVPEIVCALASLPGDRVGDTLRGIRRERRRLFLHAWPRACRDVSVRALKNREKES